MEEIRDPQKYGLTKNYVWNPSTLAWEAMTETRLMRMRRLIEEGVRFSGASHKRGRVFSAVGRKLRGQM